MAKSKFIAVGEAVFHALFDPLVVVTGMTACSLIVAVLALAWPDVNKKVFALCIVIALAGLVTIVSQMRAIYRRERRNAIIDDLYTEGHRLVQNLGAGTHPTHWKDFPNRTVRDKEQYDLMAEWCGRVEIALRQHFGESYMSRFHQGGSNEQDAREMTIWKMNHRLETLATFEK